MSSRCDGKQQESGASDSSNVKMLSAFWTISFTILGFIAAPHPKIL